MLFMLWPNIIEFNSCKFRIRHINGNFNENSEIFHRFIIDYITYILNKFRFKICSIIKIRISLLSTLITVKVIGYFLTIDILEIMI